MESWKLMAKINQDLNKPWRVIGNFNEITNQDEKFGRRLRSQKQMEAFHKALESNEFIYIGWKNPKFIWSNRH